MSGGARLRKLEQPDVVWRLLTALENGDSMAAALRAAGVARSTLTNELKRSPLLSGLIQQAEAAGKAARAAARERRLAAAPETAPEPAPAIAAEPAPTIVAAELARTPPPEPLEIVPVSVQVVALPVPDALAAAPEVAVAAEAAPALAPEAPTPVPEAQPLVPEVPAPATQEHELWPPVPGALERIPARRPPPRPAPPLHVAPVFRRGPREAASSISGRFMAAVWRVSGESRAAAMERLEQANLQRHAEFTGGRDWLPPQLLLGFQVVAVVALVANPLGPIFAVALAIAYLVAVYHRRQPVLRPRLMRAETDAEQPALPRVEPVRPRVRHDLRWLDATIVKGGQSAPKEE